MLDDKIRLYTETSRHFSGRFLSRNNTLWLSYVIKTPGYSLFIGGDGGYGSHVAEIGKKHGPFDLAVLENGQYNALWRNIHHFPKTFCGLPVTLAPAGYFRCIPANSVWLFIPGTSR